MALVRVKNCGSIGIVKDLSKHELPLGAWTDGDNVRFLDGYAQQFLGHGAAYGAPSVTPYHVLPVNVGAQRYWLYAGQKKIYAVTITGGTATHTNLTRQTSGSDVDYATVPNQITSTMFSGIPIINPGNLTDPPQRWNLNIANRCQVLDNWPANTYCKSLRAYKAFLVALNITDSRGNLPYMVKWSTAAEPGAVPATWDTSNAAEMAGEVDIAAGGDPIIDGMQLRDSFMIYKEQSVWRMDYIGGQDVMRFQQVGGISGAMNRNCVVELDGMHFVLTASDVVVHDGQTVTPVLDKQARRTLFQDMDVTATDRAFVFKNPFLNEVFVCYASIGNSVPNRALVWNYKDRTVAYRDIPSIHHANYGTVDSSLGDTWASDGDPWNSDLSAWNSPGFTPNTTRVLMASNASKLYLLDTSSTYDGTSPDAWVERVGLSFDAPESMKLVRSIRARITGNVGDTVLFDVGASDDPYTAPTYTETLTHTIGQSVACDCLVTGRYIAIRVRSGGAYFWRLDSFDIDVVEAGKW